MTEHSLYGGSDYAEQYAIRTLNDPYTGYKNFLIAKEAAFYHPPYVLDIGGCVNGLIDEPPSLRHQLELRGVRYNGLDLSPSCFDQKLLKTLPLSQNKQVYEEVSGVVGDAARLPILNGSVACLICADVIEHVPEPLRVLKEISRTIKPDGKAILVLPSLYKLDLFGFSHITEKRSSTHENKFDFKTWTSLCEQANLVIDSERSRPIGILSGLSYLVWLDSDFVPERKNITDASSYSDKAALHKQTKAILSKIDPLTDVYYQQHPDEIIKLQRLLNEGNLTLLFQEIINRACPYLEKPEIETIRQCFQAFNLNNVPSSRLDALKKMVGQQEETIPGLFISNSMLLVLKRS